MSRVRWRRFANDVNGSTLLGILLGLAAGCHFRRGPHGILFAEHYRWPLPDAGAFTVGNVVVVRDVTAAELEERLPGVLGHEAAHATQWAYCLGLPFLPAYGLASAWSQLRTGNPGSANVFEEEADLEAGRYPIVPRRRVRDGLRAWFRRAG